jgi:predicted Na+-dependent transporter
MTGLDLDSVQAILIRVVLVASMLSIGLRVTVSQLVSSVRHPRLLGAAVGLNLIVVPVIALALSQMFRLPDGIAAGIIVTGVAAGGGLGPKLVDLADGDLSFGIGLMFILDVLVAILIVPISGVLLGAGSEGISIDAWPVVGSLVLFQVLPLVCGLIVSRSRPVAAVRIGRPVTRASTVLLAGVVVVVVANNSDEVLAVGAMAVVAMLLTIAAALALGAVIPGTDPRVRRTLALTTAQRSAPLALLVVLTIDARGAVGAVVAFAMCQLLVNGAVATVLARRRSGLTPVRS